MKNRNEVVAALDLDEEERQVLIEALRLLLNRWDSDSSPTTERAYTRADLLLATLVRG